MPVVEAMNSEAERSLEDIGGMTGSKSRDKRSRVG